MMQGLAKNTRRAMRRARRRRGTELNIVSFIDILTVLVFFLLVNQISVSILGINLPDASAAPTELVLQQNLSVVVRPEAMILANNGNEIGRYARAGESYELAGLTTQLQTLKDATPDDERITLLLEPGIPYEVLVALMDAVRSDLGDGATPERLLFPEISVGAAPPPEEGAP